MTDKASVVYVAKRRSDTWHFARNCTRLPKNPVRWATLDAGERPTTGELCDECVAKERRGVALPMIERKP